MARVPRSYALTSSLGVAALILSACGSSFFGIRGSGDVQVESRDVSGFNRIELTGSGTVIVEQTGTDSLTIEAEDNLLPHLTSEVVEGTLELGSDRSISPTRDIIYRVSAGTVVGLVLTGSGEITASDISTGRLDLEIIGSGSIEVDELQTEVVFANVQGSGEIVASGATRTVDVSISGSGSFEGFELDAERADIEVSGSGDAEVLVSDRLDVRVAGSGSVEYAGNPTVHSSISGSGSVRAR